MSMLIKGGLAFFWLVLIPPALSGLLPLSRKAGIPERFLYGWLLLLSLAELLTLPALFIRFSFHTLGGIYGAVLLAGSAAGLLRICSRLRTAGTGRFSVLAQIKNVSLFTWIAVLLILLQIAAVMLLGHRDQDDAFYLATATTTLRSNKILRINPYSGYPYHAWPRRYVLSPFPVFLACISWLSGSLHPAILGHMLLPGVFLTMAYLVLSLFARRWFGEDSEKRGIFLLICVFLIWFSGNSVYRSEVFLLVRSWQGKAVLAGVMLPLLFYLELSFFRPTHTGKQFSSWLFLFLGHLSCCLLSSMGIMLAPLMTGLFLLQALPRRETRKLVLPGILSMLPCLCLGIVYLLL